MQEDKSILRLEYFCYFSQNVLEGGYQIRGEGQILGDIVDQFQLVPGPDEFVRHTGQGHLIGQTSHNGFG